PAIAHEVSATTTPSNAIFGHETPSKLRLRIVPACEIAKDRGSDDRIAAPRHLYRRVLAVQLITGAAYWSALLLFLTWVVAGQDTLIVLELLGPSLLLFVAMPAGIAWLLQAGRYRAIMNVAALLILISGLGLLLWEGQEAWGSSTIGFSLGYASIALILSAFLRPAVRGAGGPLIIAGIVGWIVLTGMFAVLLALPEPPEAVAVVALLMIIATAVWCGWLTLMYLSIRYTSKRFSDMQLALDVYWTLLTAFMLGTVVKDPFLFFLARMEAEWVCVFVIVLWLLSRWLQSLTISCIVRR